MKNINYNINHSIRKTLSGKIWIFCSRELPDKVLELTLRRIRTRIEFSTPIISKNTSLEELFDNEK